MKKIKYVIIFTLFLVCLYKCDVKALSGSGTTGSPYLVTTGSELSEALSKGTSSWKYIAITDTVAIQDTINVSKGKFRIYAKGANRTLRRSRSLDANVNSSSSPKRCIKVDGSTEIVMGYSATSYTLNIDGSADVFSDKRECNEFFYIGSNAKLTIDKKAYFKNAKCTISDNEGSPIRCYGMLNIYGKISGCTGRNGGAVKAIGGIVNIYSGTEIFSCLSKTEGGAIYGKNQSEVYMENGVLHNNEAKEEGGAIFCTNSDAYIIGGTIRNNKAGKTGGGIFTGNSGTLLFGRNGTGPTLKNNKADTSGGAIRCNGGSNTPGGLSKFMGGSIEYNTSDESGGGISIGPPSASCNSQIQIKDMTISNNTATCKGGGICFAENVEGPSGKIMSISDSTFANNTAGEGGGAFFLNTETTSENNNIYSNSASYGGGVAIATNGVLTMPSGVVNNNAATKGAGIFESGLFRLSKAGYINKNNDVYLKKDTHIDVVGKLEVSGQLASYINPEVKTKGTILVDVTYNGGTSDSELYETGSADSETVGEEVTKKFATKGNHVLRPSTKNSQFNSSRYIIISEKYTVKYNGNTSDSVNNLPDDQYAFWKEKYKVADNSVSRVGFVLDSAKHWNLSADGSGEVVKPGLDTDINADTTLYAIWTEPKISSMTMHPIDRYYVVGQKIVLDRKELTKKVKVENDLGIDVEYEVVVTEIQRASGSTIAKGSNLKTENYLNTDTGARYTLLLKSFNNDRTVSCTGKMNVYILDDYNENTDIRFISLEFLDTLNPKSKWKRAKAYELRASLENEDDYIYEVEIDKDKIRELKTNIKNNGYMIDYNMNNRLSNLIVKK